MALRIEKPSDILPKIRRKNVPDPQNAYNELIDILIMRNNFPRGLINEELYEHEQDGDTHIIHSEVEAIKPFDAFSQVVIEFELDIEMTPVRNEEFDYVGDIDLIIEGVVRTEYPQDTTFQKSIISHAFRVFYEKLLYSDVQEIYIQKCNKYVRRLRDGIKSYFDMVPTIE